MEENIAWWYSFFNDLEVPLQIREHYSHIVFPDYTPDPYVMYAGNFNNLASSDNEADSSVPSIFMLGDSTVAHPQLCNALELAAIRKHHKYKIFNLGVVAANSAMVLARLLHQCVDAHPAIVIVVGGGIDIMTPLSFDPRPGMPHIHFAVKLIFEHFLDKDENSLWAHNNSPLTGEKLRERFFDQIAELRQATKFGMADWENAIVADFEKIFVKCSS